MGRHKRLIGLAVLLAGLLGLFMVAKNKPSDKAAGWPFDATEANRRQKEAEGQVPVPAGWTKVTREVKVATPEGTKDRQITYYGNTIGMEFVLVPAGEFMMGSRDSRAEVARKGGGVAEWFSNEHPQHEVVITTAFYMGATEVTQEQYEKVMGHNPAHFKGAKNPVEKVSWNAATEFCRKLSDQEGVAYRLPTEAEWEYACRAGTATPFHTGETISASLANYNGNYTYGNGRKGLYWEKTAFVSSLPANPWGLYDMHGNVCEWCADRYGRDYYCQSPGDDPQGPATGDFRVLRGGSWSDVPFACRSAVRVRLNQTDTYRYFGFRLVVSGE